MRRLARLLGRDDAPVPGNQLELLQSGAEFFPALIAAIDAAQHDVHLETYIFNPDASGTAVRDALLRATARGVRVQVMIDAIGTRRVDPEWFAPLAAANALGVYRPLHPGWRLRPASLRRLHRKLAVIDARLAFVGGMNLIDDFEPAGHAQPRLDFAVRLEGPLLARIYPAVFSLWRRLAFAQWRGELARNRPLAASWPTGGHSRAAFVTRDNLAHRRDIERSYRAVVALAQRRVDIASAYFLPGWRLRRLLALAARRGVRVRLLVQGVSDHRFYQRASEALYADLLAAGVEIYVYTASELHAKVAVVDDDWATVGSSNIDPFSLLLAREANIVTDDAAFCSELRGRLDAAIRDGATALDPARWAARGWLSRLVSRLAYGCVRGLAGLATGAHRH